MLHIVAGFPSLKESEQIARTILKTGVEYLEVQIPFSDPIADGPVIVEANQVAINKGTRTSDAFKIVENLKKDFPNAKLLLMTYCNILKQFGFEKFCKEARRVGSYGLIIPDIPIEEEASTNYLALCKKNKLHAIQVVSPITPDKRLKKIARVASGFVYCVARFGVTGASASVAPKINSYLRRVRLSIKLPLAVGFGISKRKDIETLKKQADIAVVGTQVIREFKKGGLTKVKSFCESLR